jgi:hypothetical protein
VYLDIATRVGTAFKRKIQINGTGLIWDNGVFNDSNDPGNTAGVPDTSHATDAVRLVVSMYEAGIVFSLSDVQRLTNTLTDIIWDGSTSAPRFANYINGANTTYRNIEAWRNGAIYPGWALLGKYSAKAQNAMSYLLKAMIDGGNPSPSISANASSYGFVAQSGHLLRNSSIAGNTLSAVTSVQKPSSPINLLVTRP